MSPATSTPTEPVSAQTAERFATAVSEVRDNVTRVIKGKRAEIDPDELVYVGDSRCDIIAARAAGCRVVSVTYGYNRPDTLEALCPDELIDNLAELCAFVGPPPRDVYTQQSI